MTIKELKHILKAKIISNDYLGILEILDEYIDNGSKNAYMLWLLTAEYRKIIENSINGQISSAEKEVELRKLAIKLVDFSNFISDDDIKKSNFILTICKNETDKLEMIEYFRRMHLPNTVVKIESDEDIDPTPFMLIIFNNGKNPSETQKALMERFVNETDKLMIHFGEHYNGLNRERFNASNSKFTLFGSIKAVLAYIENDRMYQIKD